LVQEEGALGNAEKENSVDPHSGEYTVSLLVFEGDRQAKLAVVAVR
jgi:hypothetical protein